MTDKQVIDGKECRYWFRPKPCDYRKCSLRGENDNCDEITDCYIRELLGKLALKEQECKKNQEIAQEAISKLCTEKSALYNELNQLKEKNEKMSRGYAELTETVIPYIDDFSGYNEELNGFDIVLCVKELLQQFQEESKELYYRLGCSATREQKGKRCKQALKEVQQIILNIRNDKNFVGEGKLWQMIFDIDKIISESEVENE